MANFTNPGPPHRDTLTCLFYLGRKENLGDRGADHYFSLKRIIRADHCEKILEQRTKEDKGTRAGTILEREFHQ